MGFINSALSVLGLEQTPKSNTQGPVAPIAAETKANTMTTGASAWHDVYGGASGTQFNAFTSMKQQLNSYSDWVYAATHTIAEQASAVDLRVFMNNTKAKNSTLSHKFIYDKNTILKYQRQMTTGTILKDGKLVKKDNIPALEELENHPLLDLLNSPNPFQTRNEFFEMTFLHMELTGNAFWAIERNKKGQPIELWPLMPQLVAIVPDKEKFILGYIYNVNSEEIPFAPEDIIHHKYANPIDLRMGASPIQAAARAIDTDQHAADYNRKFFYNSAQPDAVLYTDNEIDEKMYTRLVSQWHDTYGGTANSHKTAILENGLKYMPRVLTQKDMDFLAGRNFNRDMILAILGVPRSLLGIDESMGRSNAETTEYVFVKGKIRPKMLRLCARITQDLAPQFDKKIIISFTDPVPSDKQFVLEEKKVSNGGLPWRTINELRAEDGDQPIPGGDEIYIPSLNMPIGMLKDAKLPEDKPAVVEEDPTKPDDTGEPEDTEDDKTRPGEATNNKPAAGGAGSTTSDTSTGGSSSSAPKSVSSPTSKKKDKTDEVVHSHHIHDEGGATVNQRNKDFTDVRNTLNDKFEIQFLRSASNLFLSQKKEILENLEARFGKTYKPNSRKMTQQQSNNINDLYDKNKSNAAWVAAFLPIFAVAIAQTGTAALDYAIAEATSAGLTPLTTDYPATAQAVTDFMASRTSLVSSSINAETDKQLKTSLAQGINAGEDLAGLASRVESIFGAFAGFRAEKIARTESITATTWATRDAWRLSGVVSGQQWVTGSNPCAFCASMAGTVIGVGVSDTYFNQGDTLTLADGQSMTFSYQDINGPPAHVNCACSLLPILN
jgi:HK97 family phage portal protein